MTKFLSRKEVEAEFNIPVRTLIHWAKTRQGPPYYSIGKRIFYKDHEIENFFDAHKIQNGSIRKRGRPTKEDEIKKRAGL